MEKILKLTDPASGKTLILSDQKQVSPLFWPWDRNRRTGQFADASPKGKYMSRIMSNKA